MAKMTAERADQSTKWMSAGNTESWADTFTTPGVVSFNNGHLGVSNLTPPLTAFPFAITIDHIPDHNRKMALVWFRSDPQVVIVICPEGIYFWDETFTMIEPYPVIAYTSFVPFSPAVNIESGKSYKFKITNPTGDDISVSVEDAVNPSGVGVATVTLTTPTTDNDVYVGRRSGRYYITIGPTFKVPDQTRIVSIANF